MEEQKSNRHRNIVLFLSVMSIVFFIGYVYIFGIRPFTKFFAIVFITSLIFVVFYRIELRDQIYASCLGVIAFFFALLFIDYLINKTFYDWEEVFPLFAMYYVSGFVGFLLKKDP